MGNSDSESSLDDDTDGENGDERDNGKVAYLKNLFTVIGFQFPHLQTFAISFTGHEGLY